MQRCLKESMIGSKKRHVTEKIIVGNLYPAQQSFLFFSILPWILEARTVPNF